MDGDTAAVFVAFLVLVGVPALFVWRRLALERERQKTIRLAIERGQQLDAALVEKMLAPATPQRSPNPFLVPIGLFSGGVGVACFGVLVSQAEGDALWPLLGIGCMIAVLGLGLFLAQYFGQRGRALSPESLRSRM